MKINVLLLVNKKYLLLLHCWDFKRRAFNGWNIILIEFFPSLWQWRCTVSVGQWRRLHGARGHVPPTFTNGWARGSTVSRRTANNKPTKLYWPSRKRSPKRLIVLLEPKTGGTTKKNFPALCAGSLSPTFALDGCPHFQIRSGATGVGHFYFLVQILKANVLAKTTSYSNNDSNSYKELFTGNTLRL